jgi:hypothetical protein
VLLLTAAAGDIVFLTQLISLWLGQQGWHMDCASHEQISRETESAHSVMANQLCLTLVCELFHYDGIFH